MAPRLGERRGGGTAESEWRRLLAALPRSQTVIDGPPDTGSAARGSRKAQSHTHNFGHPPGGWLAAQESKGELHAALITVQRRAARRGACARQARGPRGVVVARSPDMAIVRWWCDLQRYNAVASCAGPSQHEGRGSPRMGSLLCGNPARSLRSRPLPTLLHPAQQCFHARADARRARSPASAL